MKASTYAKGNRLHRQTTALVMGGSRDNAAMRLRHPMFLALCCLHLGGVLLPMTKLPVIAATGYLPLAVLDSLGLPVFSRADLNAWPPTASPIGIAIVAAAWMAVWYGCAVFFERLVRSPLAQASNLAATTDRVA